MGFESSKRSNELRSCLRKKNYKDLKQVLKNKISLFSKSKSFYSLQHYKNSFVYLLNKHYFNLCIYQL